MIEDGQTVTFTAPDDSILHYDIGDTVKIHGFMENKYSLELRYILMKVETDEN
jgi:hypothetical protein